MPLQNCRTTSAPISIENPNGTRMTSTHEGELPLTKLPLEARRAHCVPGLASYSLISVPQLCDAGCDVIFSADSAKIINKSTQELLYTAHRDGHSRLWISHLPTSTMPHTDINNDAVTTSFDVDNTTWVANAAIGSPTAADLVAYSHASLCSPVPSTLEKALKNNYIRGFPGLTAKSLRKHPPNSIATAKGYLSQMRARNKPNNLSKLVVLDPWRKQITRRMHAHKKLVGRRG